MATALVIIDMQMVMQHRIEAGRDSVNPDAATRIHALADHFRHKGMPVIHVRHRDDDPSSSLHPDADGYGPIPGTEERSDEATFLSARLPALHQPIWNRIFERTESPI